MKKIIKAMISLLVFCVVYYFFGAYIAAEINPIQWTLEGRFAHIALSLISFGIYLMATAEVDA